MTSTDKRVGVVYDEELLKHKPIFEHVECPERIESIYEEIQSNSELAKKLIPVKGRLATEDEISAVHHPRFFQKLTKTLTTNSIRNSMYGDMYANNDTLHCVLLAAGSSIQLAEEIAQNKLDSGFAIIRPPGHHSCSDKYGGFCFLNNVMMAANVLTTKYRMKVLVVDWDVHVGDGSINIMKTSLRENENLRYFSIHRYDNGNFYPGGKVGKSGFDLDMKILKVGFYGSKDNDFYLETFQNSLMPWAKEFSPDMILVSCGFDAASGDPLGECHVTPYGYFQMTEILKQICPKICLVLEGGYNLNSISKSAVACLESLIQ